MMDEELVCLIAAAARKAFSELFERHPGKYYYCSLITTGEALPPAIVAWSVEALDEAVSEAEDGEEARRYLKWSYADSPYYAFGYDEYFGPVVEAFSLRPKMDHETSREDWDKEYEYRLSAMEEAMRRLDEEGLFGRGDERLKKVVNVEVMPPDYTNTERGLRLNPKEALGDWLEEIAEEPD